MHKAIVPVAIGPVFLLLCATAILGPKFVRPKADSSMQAGCGSFAGVWKNGLGSTLKIDKIDLRTGQIAGTYEPYSGKPGERYPLSGWVTKAERKNAKDAASMICFSVLWGGNSGIVHSWTGYYKEVDDVPILVTKCHVGMSLAPMGENHILVKDERFTRANERAGKMTRKRSRRRSTEDTRRFRLASLIVCFAFAGCGKPLPNLAEVEGTVKMRGKPLPGVMVYFIPDAPKESVKGVVCPPSTGLTDEQGHYQLTCQAPPLRGAIVGTHRVTILDPDRFDDPEAAPGDLAPRKPRKRKPKKDQVDMKYMTPAQTPLIAEVRAGGPQVIDFNVK